MNTISLDTAVLLTGQTKRHLRRRIAEGNLVKEGGADPQGRTHIALAPIAASIGFPLTAEDVEAILQADAGQAAAQHEVALMFLTAGKPERALSWLQLAVAQGCADAMYTLGENLIEGLGVPPKPKEGFVWIEKAALKGHGLAQQVTHELRLRFGDRR